MAYNKSENNKKGNTNKKYTKPEKVIREFYLNASNYAGTREFDRKTLLDILCSVPFSQISIPVHLDKALMNGDGTSKGYANVGYITGYDPQDEKFTTVIYNNYEKAVDAVGEAVIYARAIVDKSGVVRNIIALDIEPIVEEEEFEEVSEEEIEDIEK